MSWSGSRAVTDYVLRAYVEDVIVSPGLRRSGVGQALLTCLLEQVRPTVLVTLFCSPGLVSYYKSLGFHATRQVVLHPAAEAAVTGLATPPLVRQRGT
jgi:ribosomal protein S18 acetylase RimI-like enzyme